jgi:hypothetical protein
MRVIALELGYDNVALRNPGDEFEMPDDVFKRRPRVDANGKAIAGAFYEPPSWFEPVDPKMKAKVEADREEILEINASVPAVDPAKQLAEYQAALQALASEVEDLKKLLAAKKP